MNGCFTFKKISAAVLLLGSVFFANAQPDAYPSGTQVSFIRTWDATAPEVDGNNLMVRPLHDVRQVTAYYDGLGRLVQTVAKQGSLETSSGINADLVSPVVYDQYGREQNKYLPFAANNTGGNTLISDGNFKLNPFQEQKTFMQSQYGSQGETYFYSQSNFEASPLNRVTKAMPAGNSWVGSNRGVIKGYWYNTPADGIVIWTVIDVANGWGTYAVTGSYPAGVLVKTALTDEQGNQVLEFKDKEGRLILKKVQLTASVDNGAGSDYTGWLCTYYIYDDFNRLRCVVQPASIPTLTSNGWQLTSSLLSDQCFRYEYDYRSRMIRKQVPGAAEVWMVYDAQDRLVMTQDANMRATQKWLYTTYDNLNRPVSTGIMTDPANYNNLTYHLNLAVNSSSYPNLGGYSTEELTVNFYDSYAWLTNYGNPLPSTYNNSFNQYFQTASNNWPYPQIPAQTSLLKGLPTGSRTKILGSSTYLYTVSFYDNKGEIIQAQGTNITGATDIVTTQYTWSGQPLITTQQQQKNGTNAQITVLVTQNNYDDLGRILSVQKKIANTLINSNAMPTFNTIVQNQYDKLGQLNQKILSPNYTPPSGGNGLETLNYEYNIRGWLLGANRDFARDASQVNYFGFDLGYDKQNNNLIGGATYTAAQYNGNVTGMVWKSKGDGQKRRYDFTYDAANRLTGAAFTQYGKNTNIFDKSDNVDFSVSNLWYDFNGNIMSVNQNGLKVGTGSSPLIDQLTYNYQTGTNKLQMVSDAANDNTSKLGDFKYNPSTKTTIDYSYDVNGNLTADNNKAISSITYNHLNLPLVITITSKGTIAYTYDAAGNKLQKQTIDNTVSPSVTTTTLYIENAVYQNDGLQFIGHEEGRVRYSTANGTPTLVYDYMLKDHLGNVRMVLTEEQKTSIYPATTLEGNINSTNDAINYENSFYTITGGGGTVVPSSQASGIQNYQNNNGIANPYPTGNNGNSNYGLNSQNVYKLQATSGSGNGVTGLGITLKVMAGDVINVFGKSYYNQSNTGAPPPSGSVSFLNILAGFLGAPAGAVAAAGHGDVSASNLTNLSNTTGGIQTLFNNQTANYNGNTSKPKAFINYLLFDENFNCVGSGLSMVGTINSVYSHTDLQNIAVPKNGYIYVYCSNESLIPVFFDNLQVTHTRGPILEETHYYPFGLTMAGISSKALNFGAPQNKCKYNGNELQNQEFSDGSGLEGYDFGARILDHQIGRWNAVDPSADNYKSSSPYSFCLDNPINFVDYDGRDIIVVTSSGNFTLAKETLLKTKEGKKLWDKYGNSKTHDIYITIGQIRNGHHILAQTNKGFMYDPKKFNFSALVKDGEIHAWNHVGNELFRSFEGTNISNSKGRQISFVLLNEEYYDEDYPMSYETNKRSVNNFTEIPFNLAETLFHEIKAHIDFASHADQHGDYGINHSGVFMYYFDPKKGSPAETIKNQLYQEYLKGFIDDPKDNPLYIPIDPNISKKAD